MADNSLFQTEQQSDEFTLDDTKNYLDELVGEGKKFKDPESLAKGKAYADATIEVYKRRLDEAEARSRQLFEENTTKASLEELVKQIATRQDGSTTLPSENPDASPAMNRNDIESIILSKIQETERKKQADENMTKVQSKIKERFGTNTNALKEQINNLGLTEKDAEDLARSSPNLLIKALGLDSQPQETYQSTPRSSQRSDNFSPKGAQKRSWSYYQGLKEKDPQAYFDPKIGAQMAKDAVDQGDAFFDGNFYVKGLHERN